MIVAHCAITRPHDPRAGWVLYERQPWWRPGSRSHLRHSAAPPSIVVGDGVTQPEFGYADAVRERVWVDTDLDSDRDGASDRTYLRTPVLALDDRACGLGARV